MGRRGKKCPICSVPALAAQVQAERDSGASYTQIAALTGVNKFSISRHFRHVEKPVTADDNSLSPLERSERRLAELAERAEQSWLSAAAVGDSKAALDVLKSQIRLEVDQHKRLLQKAEQVIETEDASKVTPEKIDGLLKIYRQKKAEREKRGRDLAFRGFVRCPLCSVAESPGNWVFPGAIQKRWAECRKVYDIWCDAQSKKMEEQHAASAVQ